MSAAFASLAAFIAIAWGVTLAVLLRRQARVLFGSPRARRTAPSGTHAAQPSCEVRLAVHGDARLQGWLASADAPADHVLVWFGGRNEDVGWTPAIGSWLGPGWAICAFNYRGCAGSTGEPGEDASVRDALAITAWAMARTGLPCERVVLAGRSLGSAVALQVAARLPVGGVVLLSPFASARRLLLRHPLLWPALPWLRHPFDSIAATASVRCASLVLLAERDRRVPHGESRLLARALRRTSATGCEVRTIAGTDHRTLARHADSLAAMTAFLHGLAARARHHGGLTAGARP